MFSWNTLSSQKIFSSLAPMEDVTDTVFRQILIEIGRPDVFFTEFTNLEGLFSKGYANVSRRLKYFENEKPLIAQVWGTTPQLYYEGSKIIKEKGFSGIDINMGCPVENVIKKGACSALIKNKPLAKEIIDATKEGCIDFPLSIKTRLGFNEIQTEDWIGFLLEQNPNALTIHLRTVKELSKVPPHYDQMLIISKLRDELSPNTVLICNGDIKSIQDGEKLCKEYSFNGYMIGKAAISNPWVFSGSNAEDIDKAKRLELSIKHVTNYMNTWGEEANFEALKKFLKHYMSNFDGAKELREQMMLTKTSTEALNILTKYYND